MMSFISLISLVSSKFKRTHLTEICNRKIDLLKSGEKNHDQKIMFKISLKITNLWFFFFFLEKREFEIWMHQWQA